MKKIGLISDTHSDLDQKILDFLNPVDEIWHAGDIGSFEVIECLRKLHPVRAVYGNIDDHIVRSEFPMINRFLCEDVNVLMIHIGGYPGRFEKKVKDELLKSSADLVISGHSHILKAIYDNKYNLLHLNPGAAGIVGFHAVRTAMRFNIEGKEIKDLEILELPRFRNNQA